MRQNGAVLFVWAWVRVLCIVGGSSGPLPRSDVQNFRGREGELESLPPPKTAGDITRPLDVTTDQTTIQLSMNILNQSVVDKTKTANATLSPPSTTTTSVPESVETVRTIDLSKPGVLKRAILVFGGFSLIAVAYLIFYRKRQMTKLKDNINHPSGDPQFRYGMLHTDDKPDRMELSNLPLSMESDDDDEEDLDIFDLGQKKKSLSYTTMSTHDRNSVIDDIISSAGKSDSQEPSSELLLEIEDRNTPAVIPVTSANRYEI